MNKFCFILFILIITSCVNNVQEYNLSLDTIIAEEIIEYIDRGDLFEAFQLLTYYNSKQEKQDLLDIPEITLNKKLPHKLKRHYKNNEWDDFFITYKNMQSLGLDLSTYDINKIQYNYIVENIENKLFKSGVLLGENKLDYSGFSNDELLLLLNIYNNVSPKDDFPKLINELNHRKVSYIINDINHSNYLDGVITVFVNKGINFDQGIGTQDINVGSGFFIDKKGHAITNYHVVESVVDPEYEGLSNLYIKLNNSIDKVPAKVIGWDAVLDIALIKVSAIPEFIYSFSNDDNIKIGDKVVAVGSPGGLGSTVTSGIISAKDRALLEIGSVIQIDSPINPGNSGGPLIDDKNKVTNIVFAGIEVFEGVNFAIPIRYLKAILQSLYKGNYTKHVWLGAGIIERKNRLEIIYIKPGSPANYLGLEKGDLLLDINNIKFDSVLQVQDYLINLEPLEIISLSYARDGVRFNKQICLEERPRYAMENIVKGDTSEHLYNPIFGMDILYTGKILWNKEYLIKDVYPGTIAAELDLIPGDIIEVKSWEYNEEYEAVILNFVIQSQSEGFWQKPIQIVAPISINFFI